MTPTEILQPPAATDYTVDQEQDMGYGPNNEELPEDLVNILRDTVKELNQQEQYLRRLEVIHDRRNRFYERGYQHVYWNSSAGGVGQGGFMQTMPDAMSGNGTAQAPNYVDDYNIFQPFLRIIEAILTQTPATPNFQPNNPDSSEDIDAAEAAELYRKYYDRSNDIRSIQRQIVRMMGLSGRTILWTRTEEDEQKWGRNPETGQPRRMECTSVHGSLESKVSILAKCLGDTLYCFLYDDPDVRAMKAEYPGFAKKIKSNTTAPGENAYERWARLGVLQGNRNGAQTLDAYAHTLSRLNGWLRPDAFSGDKYDQDYEGEDARMVMDEDGSQHPQTIREKLLELFPQGCHVTFCGDTYVGSWPEAMEDCLAMGFPYEGDGLFRMAIMDPMVVVQDAFNDAMNAAREVFDVGWPSTWVNADESEYDAIVEQRADPYAIRQKKARSDQALTAEFFREPNPELPQTFITYIEMLQGPLPQFQIAAPPALFGAAMEDQKTASGYAQARAQAMGQQGLTYQSVQQLMAEAYYQAALLAAKNPDHATPIVIPGDGNSNQPLDVTQISKGNFKAYPDQDQSYPESTQAKRATLQNLIVVAAQSPQGVQIFDAPDNAKLICNLMGFPELTIPEAEARDKQLVEIEILLKQAPLPPTPEEIDMAQKDQAMAVVAGGAPEQPFNPASLEKSSVPIKELDFHQWEFAKCQDWLSSADCRRQLALGNEAGVRNVELHAKEHQKAMQAQQMAMMAMQPPAEAKGSASPPRMPEPGTPPKPPQATAL